MAHYKKQLRGWLSYAFARYLDLSEVLELLSDFVISEVFVIVSLTLFLPICLEQFARDNGFLLPERTEPCSSVSTNAKPSITEGRCVVKVGWLWIDSASFRCAISHYCKPCDVRVNGFEAFMSIRCQWHCKP